MNRDDLIAYVDGELTPEECRRVEQELERDPESAEVLAALLRQRLMLAENFRTAPAVSPMKRFHRFVPRDRRAFPWGLLVAAAGFLFLVVGVSLWNSSGRTSKPVARQAPVAKGPAAGQPPEPARVKEPSLAPAVKAPAPREETPAPPPVEETSPPPPAEKTPPPSPPRPAKTPDEAKITIPAIARLERVQGDVTLLDGDRPTPAKPGQEVLEGQGLRVAGAKDSAIVIFPDKTRLEIGPNTAVSMISAKPETGKRLFLPEGTIDADVPRQPVGRQMVFATKNAEAMILGTRFTIFCRGDLTEVEVKRGKVRLTRADDRTSVDVEENHFAIVRPGIGTCSQSGRLDAS